MNTDGVCYHIYEVVQGATGATSLNGSCLRCYIGCYTGATGVLQTGGEQCVMRSWKRGYIGYIVENQRLKGLQNRYRGLHDCASR
jgi:hypothetical protein